MPCSQPDFTHWLYCYRNNEFIGGYDRKSGKYYPKTGPGAWGLPCVPPAPVPSHLAAWPPISGVVADKIIGTGYRINGKECTKEEAYELLRRTAVVGQLVDDSQKLRLTVIGTEAECEPVLNDLKTVPNLADLAKELLITYYRPNHWHVDGVFEPGVPSIYYQQADGKVLARLTKYPGATQFAEFLRKRHPKYDPSKDPGLPKKLPIPIPPKVKPATPHAPAMELPDPVTTLGIGAGAITLLAALLRRK